MSNEHKSEDFDPKPQAVPEGPFSQLDPENRPSDQWLINESLNADQDIDFEILELLQAREALIAKREKSEIDPDSFRVAHEWIMNRVANIRADKA